MVVGGIVGLVNGLAITKLKVVPFIATLGMLGIARGVAKWVANEQTVTVPAEEAYGPHDDARVQAIPRSAIPEDVAVDVGTRLQANTPDGEPVNLTVVDLDDSSVTVDANHPLAGRDLVFDLELVEVIAA